MALTASAPLSDVITDKGRVDAKKLAKELDVTIPALARALGKSSRSVNDNPTAASIQGPALQLVHALSALAGTLGGVRFAAAWLKTPTAQFGGHSPVEVLREPKGLEAVLGLVDAIVRGEPD